MMALAIQCRTNRLCALFVSELGHPTIPFGVNSDNKFYDRENHQWIKGVMPWTEMIVSPAKQGR